MKYVINIDLENPISEGVYADLDTGTTWILTERMLQKLIPLEKVKPVIRCKDCKHKPHTSDKYDYDNGDCGFEIIFPDYRCPCRCEDEYYNHIPDDDWFCGNAERRTDE